MQEKLDYWCERLEVSKPKTFRVNRSQVTNDYDRPYRFVGYCRKDDTIYYDQQIGDITILHELLHKKFPRLGENTVRKLTKIILW